MMYPLAQSSALAGGDIRASVQIAIFILLAVALGAGVFSLLRQPQPDPVEILHPTATSLPEIKVYVNGAVNRPGVYTVDADDRLEDVLALAGGLTADADESGVNLAARVSDEAHFYIPAIGETPPVASTDTAAPSVVNINTATAEELQMLRGIGEQKAADIVLYREENGPFARAEDLLNVTGIGPKTLEDLLPYITVR